jgi:hypothetical protein
VWSEQKQSGIIDSILRNYYIPPVIFGAYLASSPTAHAHMHPAAVSSDDRSELPTCIDGKQTDVDTEVRPLMLFSHATYEYMNDRS